MTSGADESDRSDDDRLVAEAESLAARLLHRADELRDHAERAHQARVAAMVDDPASREFLVRLTDEVLRIEDPAAFAHRFRSVLGDGGVHRFAGLVDGLLLHGGSLASRLLPGVVRAQVEARLRRELADIVLDADPSELRARIADRRSDGFTLNVNPLGEAVLGDDEAARRHRQALDLLADPEVDYVSVKASAVCANLDVVDFAGSVARVTDRVSELFEAAAGADPPRFVNLDMEEYADLALTVHAFRAALDRPSLQCFSAGIALQAYLPDSVAAFDEIAAWARRRVDGGGAPVKVRLVKGANLAMERVDAELHGWPLAPFPSKAQVDANYKRLLDRAFDPSLDGVIGVGVASHNLFDLAWAMTLLHAAGEDRPGLVDRVDLEMLHGMADAEARAASELAGRVVLYTPVVAADDFGSATAYLVRRFDENTQPENFLTHLPGMEVGSSAWVDQAERFRVSVRARRESPQPSRRRAAAAGTGSRTGDTGHGSAQAFVNQPDADLAVASARERIATAIDRFRFPAVVEARIDGADLGESATRRLVTVDDPNTGSTAYRAVGVDVDDVDRAVAVARRAAARRRDVPAVERRLVLDAAADELERARPDLVAAMCFDGAKTVREADPEVSEAIDFARYYGRSALDLERSGAPERFDPYGVVAVVAPWNFPLAIPAGGMFAALAAGSAVLLKPATATTLLGRLLAERCWAAGVPDDVLQLVITADGDTGRHLTSHHGVDAVVLTGSSHTAHRFRTWRPDLRLHAETSGKNSLVVTASADLDEAIRDLVRSAFGHAGQKCSAASLAIVEASVLDRTRFTERLADAVRSLRVGAGPNPATQVGPLISPPGEDLQRALTTLDHGETWLVEPRRLGHDRAWTPGVRLGVQAGSWFHQTECFGPVLGVMRARDLDHAIQLQNGTAYGLTAGISSLDDDQVARWLDRVEAGNLYVNRHITGAIVSRQPFGGWKGSSVGPGVKAGGPFYVGSLGRWSTAVDSAVSASTTAAFATRVRELWHRWRDGVDAVGLVAEANVLRLRALPRGVLLRLGDGVPPEAVQTAAAVAEVVGVPLTISTPEDADLGAIAQSSSGSSAEWKRSVSAEDEASFVVRATGGDHDRVRLLGDHPAALLAALVDAGVDTDLRAVSADPTQELLCWTREQAISWPQHRHGNPRPTFLASTAGERVSRAGSRS